MWKKIQKFWWFTFRNPVVRQGEAGGFRWCFRRLSLEIETLSGNFKAKFTADESPFAYLLAGDDDQTHGFALRLYMIGKLMTREQKFVDDLDKALKSYEKRAQKQVDVVEDETEEKIAIEETRSVQEHIELPEKERKKRERETNGRFKKAVAQSLKEKEA